MRIEGKEKEKRSKAGEELRRRLENKERKCAVLRSEQMLNGSWLSR